MATAAAGKDKGTTEVNFQWEGKDKSGKAVRGDLRASGENVVKATLRRQGITVSKVKKQRMGGGGSAHRIRVWPKAAGRVQHINDFKPRESARIIEVRVRPHCCVRGCLHVRTCDAYARSVL